MDYEAAIGEFLGAWGSAFISAQYDVPYDPEQKWGGSSPDFVAIDFKEMDVAVVEVSAASDLDGLVTRCLERERCWYAPIRAKLIADHVITDDWPKLRLIAFIREDYLRWMEERLPFDDVTCVPIESALLPYEWFDQRKLGLPNKFSATGFGRGNPRGLLPKASSR